MTNVDSGAATSLAEFIAVGDLAGRSAGWPRVVVSEGRWNEAIDRLAAGQWTMLGLWSESGWVHLGIIDEPHGLLAILSLDCPEGHYPSVARNHNPAFRLERAVKDLSGLEAIGAPDQRPWLDHGHWGISSPLGAAAEQRADSASYQFLPSEGPGLHQIAVGPVHAGVIEPGHFRFTVVGELIVRLEARFGYAHKGIEALMAGASLAKATTLAARVSGDSSVAYALAFARAVESALGVAPPPRSVWLRALMAELERIANHLGDIGAVCNDAAFAMLNAHCGVLREQVLRSSATAFGHRLIRDRIIPGGVTGDLAGDGELALRQVLDLIRHHFPRLVGLYDETASLQDRTVGAGKLAPVLARQFGAGGYVGRASGRAFDARRMPGYPPYDQLHFDVPVLEEGDVNARVWIRIREVEQSLHIIEQILSELPTGPIAVPLASPAIPSEGIALVEGFRGDILAWVRLDADRRVLRSHLRDPSWFQWPLLEAAIEGNIVGDFPLCNKSFNCSYSGHDL